MLEVWLVNAQTSSHTIKVATAWGLVLLQIAAMRILAEVNPLRSHALALAMLLVYMHGLVTRHSDG